MAEFGKNVQSQSNGECNHCILTKQSAPQILRSVDAGNWHKQQPCGYLAKRSKTYRDAASGCDLLVLPMLNSSHSIPCKTGLLQMAPLFEQKQDRNFRSSNKRLGRVEQHWFDRTGVSAVSLMCALMKWCRSESKFLNSGLIWDSQCGLRRFFRFWSGTIILPLTGMRVKQIDAKIVSHFYTSLMH